MDMREISLSEFNAKKVDRHPRAAEFFTEKRWFECGKLLGVLLLDNDAEWGYVVLADHGKRGFAAIDMAASFATAEQAIASLALKFKEHEGVTISSDDGPMSPDQLVAAVAIINGCTIEHAQKILKSLERSDGVGRA